MVHRHRRISKCVCVCVCVCYNANPLHYYMLRVPLKADRWRYVWSIFNSRTAWADHITCGTSICLVQRIPNFSTRGPLEKKFKIHGPPLGFEINQTVNVLQTHILIQMY